MHTQMHGAALGCYRFFFAGAEGVAARSCSATPEPGELERSVAQLRSELDAIADALDEVTRTSPEAALAVPPADDGGARPGVRTRS